MVSYNASTAVAVTLDSLHRAQNITESKLVLIDNASKKSERTIIRDVLDQHCVDGMLSWQYIQLENNLGFAGGNNIGIQELLADNEISHICLLNSDVIVTDYWLDRLIEKNLDIVSCVTNKADSEQCVPVDYELNLSTQAIERVSAFSKEWYKAWHGNVVEADATFFCVLLSRTAVKNIGLLDEKFFPGGYEDDDYCIRARNLGYGIFLARDVFIHHWGSASFGQLHPEYFTHRAQLNRTYLEKKHTMTWQQRPEKPFVSFALDLRFALAVPKQRSLQRPFIQLYITSLGQLLDQFESDFCNLPEVVAVPVDEWPEALRSKFIEAETFGNVRASWTELTKMIVRFIDNDSGVDDDARGFPGILDDIIAAVHSRVGCVVAVHAYFHVVRRPRNRLKKLWWIVRKGIPFLWDFQGIVFFGGYPYPERQNDGYFQRIRWVDRLFTDRWRIYVESDELSGREKWYDRPEPKVLVLRIIGEVWRRRATKICVLLAVLKCRKIYYHSVLRMKDNRFGLMMRWPWITKVIDIHGVVPEEFRYHNDFYNAVRFEDQERLAVRKSSFVVVVTEAMHLYLKQKYRETLQGKPITFPMFPDFPVSSTVDKSCQEGKPIVVYAGGLHKWQQIPKMIDAIAKTAHSCVHRIYCPNPEEMRAMLPGLLHELVTVDSVTHEELFERYSQCHYGFILREDVIVNRVACPTKLVEYIGTGIVPIADCDQIGDFKSMGMKYIRLQDFIAGKLPSESERNAMATSNLAIYEKMRTIRQNGANALYEALSEKAGSYNLERGPLHRVKGFFPQNSLRGKIARGVWSVFMPKKQLRSQSLRTDVRYYNISETPQCDILVQVDNFEAGGLENVVLDLNETLRSAGYHIVLLILGTPGAAFERARAGKMPVIVSEPSPELYRQIIDKIKPRLLLTHYSIHGAEHCGRLGIPFVQVIHNCYIWFDQQQQIEFSIAAQHTTCFVAVSEYAKNYSVERLGIEESRCLVIPNGIDRRAFEVIEGQASRDRLRMQYGITENEFLFLSVGAINHQKNHMATVRAFAAMVDSCPQARLMILGPAYESNLLTEITDYITAHKLENNVMYAGSTDNAWQYYNAADAFVAASFFEGGQLSLLEAITANLPSVTSNIGFAGYFHNKPGFDVVDEPISLPSFYGHISQMRSSPDFENRLADAMIRTYTKRIKPDLSQGITKAFDKENSYQCYVKLVGAVLKGEDIRNFKFLDTWPELLCRQSPDQ